MICDISLYSGSNLVLYTHIPTIILMLALGFMVLLSDIKNKINIVYFAIVMSLVVWNFASLFSWTMSDPYYILISERVALIGMVGIAMMGLFLYIFPENRKMDSKIVLAIFAPLIPFMLILPTTLYVKGIEPPPSCETIPGDFFYLIIVALAYYIFVDIFIIIINKYKKFKEEQKMQLKVFIYGIVLMILLAILFNVLPTLLNQDDTLTLFTPLSGLIFAAFGAFAVVRFKAFNVKVLAAQILTVITWVLIGSQFFFAENSTSVVLTGITLSLSLGFGYMLIKSVKQEAERKEQLQEMATRLAQANDQLRTLDNAKTEFISIASHQLRTPITAIKGFSSLLLEGSYGEVSESVHGALEKVYSSAERLVNLVEDLLNVSRIESGRMQFTFEKASVEKLIKELYDNFILIAKNKKLYLDIKLPENPLPEIVMDYSKIRELVSNFIDNALKYTEKGGATVKAELREEGVVIDENGFVIIGKKSEFGTMIRITVSDTGIGIPKEEIPYLFKKFSRGKDVSRLHVGGTGLGLYVGKAIAETHHGQVWVESDGAGKGSRFIIEIPVDSQKL